MKVGPDRIINPRIGCDFNDAGLSGDILELREQRSGNACLAT